MTAERKWHAVKSATATAITDAGTLAELTFPPQGPGLGEVVGYRFDITSLQFIWQCYTSSSPPPNNQNIWRMVFFMWNDVSSVPAMNQILDIVTSWNPAVAMYNPQYAHKFRILKDFKRTFSGTLGGQPRIYCGKFFLKGFRKAVWRDAISGTMQGSKLYWLMVSDSPNATGPGVLTNWAYRYNYTDT